MLKSVRADLTAHVGGHPSATQRALIEQAGQLRLRLAAMDQKFAQAGELSHHDSRTYLAWSNSYGRLISRLGSKPADTAPADTIAATIAAALERGRAA